MASFLLDNADLQYYLGEGLDWDALVRLTERGQNGREGFASTGEALAFYRETAALVGELVANEIAPHGPEIDREGVLFSGGEAHFPPRLEAINRQIAEMGLHGLVLPRELHGMNAPMVMYFVVGEMLARADAGLMSHFGFHGGIATAMMLLSILEGTTELDPGTGKVLRTRWGDAIREIASGQAWGSMDITEPDAGSDMAALRARAEQDAQGRWLVSGQKIFITSGHGKYHFVIARTGDPASGLGGLSLFLVPAYRDEADGRRTRLATLDRVEEKLGHHGSVTVAVTFDRTPAELVGRPGDGFRHMLEIMNHARVGVGFQSIGLAEASFRLARAYAAERRSMGKTIDRHEMIADYLDEMEGDLVGLRALSMHGAFHDEIAQKQSLYGRFLPPVNGSAGAPMREARWHRAVARRATPLVKYLAAEKAVEIARRALQIHGGNGYMREYGAEKLLRDALVMPIYEGTSQIQALMAVKDTLGGIIKRPQAFVRRTAQARWRALSAQGLERRVARLQQLSLSAQQHLATRTVAARVSAVRRAVSRQPMSTWAGALFQPLDPRRDFSLALLHAERLTRLLADELIAEVLLDQSQRHPERRMWLERHLDRAEPRAQALHTEITTTGARLLSKLSPPTASVHPPASAGEDTGTSPTPSEPTPAQPAAAE
jgi:alkylation response protein AidB-like acyl-CoA dehydrogenase